MESWEDSAECRSPGVDPEWFFPELGRSADTARRICDRCPVEIECLEYAIRNRVAYGVWGGRSPKERRRLFPYRAIPLC